MGDVTLQVPDEHLELFRLAALHEVGSDAEWVKSMQEALVGELGEVAAGERTPEMADLRGVDLRSSKAHLDASVALVNQLVLEPGEVYLGLGLEVESDASTLAHALEAMVQKVVAPRVKREGDYSPQSASALGALAQSLAWAADQLVYLDPKRVASQPKAVR